MDFRFITIKRTCVEHRYKNSCWDEVESVDWDKVLDEILATDDKIRYAAIFSLHFNSVMSKSRDQISLLTVEKVDSDDKLVKLAAPKILGALSQLTDNCGNLICAGSRFDLITLMFFKMGDMIVVVSTEPGPPYPIMMKLEQKFLASLE